MSLFIKQCVVYMDFILVRQNEIVILIAVSLLSVGAELSQSLKRSRL